jgi:proline iminopeptidase
MLALDATHTMYWEQSGYAGGIPVLFLHGGPGAGASRLHRRFFDPSCYRIIIYDQRGAGRSPPRGELTDNTTGDLISDIECLRQHLGIDRFLLFGGSWGSTLALAYAEAYPDRCLGLVIRGVFLGRPCEIDWFLYGLRSVFPEAWRNLVNILPESERDDILLKFYGRLLDTDPAVHLPAARAWSRYEGACSTLHPSPETVSAFGEDDLAYGLARIETHYFTNGNFMSDNALLDNLDAITHLPCKIIQGRYDMICPIVTADELHRAWPGSELIIVPDAGHSAMDPGVREALVVAMERCKTQFSV